MLARQRLRPVRVSAAALGLAILAGCGGHQAPAAINPTTASAVQTPQVSSCREDQLATTYAAIPGAASGTTFSRIVLTNRSTSVCTVKGEAKVTFQDPDHHPAPIPVNTSNAVPQNTITLEPGGAASEIVSFGTDGNPPPGHKACTPATTYITITPPAATISHEFLFRAESGLCPHTSAFVRPLVAGKDVLP